MLGNLILSAGDIEYKDENQQWMNEYLQGNGHEIYRTQLSYKFEGKKFKEVAAIIYNEYQGILFAIELDIQGQKIIRLNPGTYELKNIQK